VAGVCFILPAMLIVTAIAWAYVRFGKLPEASALLYGVKPVIIAVVVQALWNLGKSAVKTKLLAAAGIIAAQQVLSWRERIARAVWLRFRDCWRSARCGKNKPCRNTAASRHSSPICRELPRCFDRRRHATASVAVAAPFSSEPDVFLLSESRRSLVRQRLRVARVSAR
jgi:hypothetical protein